MDMRRPRVIAWILLAYSANLSADVCRLLPESAETVVKISKVPGYFFKVHPSGKYVGYIGGKGNVLLNLETGAETPLIGNIDPVWTPDGKYLTTPKEKLKVYPADAIIAGSPEAKTPPAVQTDLDGVYQSVGLRDGGYRVVTDLNGVSMGGFDSSFGRVSEIQRPCQNVANFPTDLPMISKDGRYLSVYDSSSKSTKIFALNSGECALALDLGFPTGKVSFNADSSEIAFHVDQFGNFDSGYFSGVGKDKIKNVMVVKLDIGPDGQRLTPNSWAMASRVTTPGNGGYYPDFDAAGNLYFMEDQENFFQIVRTNPERLDWRPMDPSALRDCVNCEGASQSPLAALARLWSSVCPNNLPLERAPVLTDAIDPAACRAMVEQLWTPALNVPKDALLRSCPQSTAQAPTVIGAWDEHQMANGTELLQTRCLMCHSAPREYDKVVNLNVLTSPTAVTTEQVTVRRTLPSFQNLNSQSLAQEMMEAIQSGAMPKGMKLTEQDQNTLLMYLTRQQLDMPEQRSSSKVDQVRRYDDAALEVERQKAFATLSPESGAEERRLMTVLVNCFYGQRDCEAAVEIMRPQFVTKAQRVPEAERPAYIANLELSFRCQNLMNVTLQQCYDLPEAESDDEEEQDE